MKIKNLQRYYQNIYDPKDVDILLAECIKKNTTYLYTHPEYRVGIFEYLRFWRYAHLRRRGFSVAAIVGHKEFFSLDFLVNRHVLVPRPETELMVEIALQKLTPETILVDVGTGTGCIPTAILKNYSFKIRAFATDISSKALRVAKKNAARHGVNIKFLQGNLLEPILKTYKLPATTYELVLTANLPYLTLEQFNQEKSIHREPYNALVGGQSGLELYEKLLEQVNKIDTKKICLFEIDPSQAETLRQHIAKHYPAAAVEIKKDLALRDRLMIITFTA